MQTLAAKLKGEASDSSGGNLQRRVMRRSRRLIARRERREAEQEQAARDGASTSANPWPLPGQDGRTLSQIPVSANRYAELVAELDPHYWDSEDSTDMDSDSD